MLAIRRGVHVGEQRDEWSPGIRREAVCDELVDLADFGVEFVADDDRAELPVEHADGGKLLAQECDDRVVDAPGGIE